MYEISRNAVQWELPWYTSRGQTDLTKLIIALFAYRYDEIAVEACFIILTYLIRGAERSSKLPLSTDM